MKALRPSLFALSLTLISAPFLVAQQEAPDSSELPKVVKAKAFEIGTSNLFEALRQMAAYRKLDLVIDPEVQNRKGLYAFKHTTWEKALATLLNSNGLAWEIRDGILHVGQGSRAQNDQSRFAAERGQVSRIISITYRPSAEGEALLSVNVSKATRAEIMEALSKLERIAKAKPDRHSFNASWVLRPMKENSHDELETFSMEDITPNGLRALYP
jgi:hypothetical protein